MAKKHGDVRVRQRNTIYGPMTHADVEKLHEAGRIKGTDQVSVRNSPWRPLDEYLASATSPPPSTQPFVAGLDQPSVPVAGRKEGLLRVLKGKRIFGSLSKPQVADLLASGRVDEDDLICALDGPWMRLADFFAPPRTASPPPASLEEEPEVYRPPEGVVEPEVVTAEVVEEEEVVDLDAGFVTAAAGYTAPLLGARRELVDEWFVKVRGIHSAPLRKHHVRMLFQAREITPDCPARHPSWKSENWWPIKSIPELAEVLTP